MTSVLSPYATRIVAVVLIALWSIAMILVCGDVMRESDQASLLDGAMQLAKSPVRSPEFHNYSGQFGSYWFLAGLQQFFEFSSLQEYVGWGNRVATSSLVLGVTIFVGSCWKHLTHVSGRIVLIFISLTIPAFLLSAPLLASNVLAGAAVLLLVSSRSLWFKWWGVVLGAGLVFLAVCLRKDALFVMPLICFMPQRDLSLKLLFRERYLWAFIGAAFLALFIGKLLASSTYMPDLLTDLRLIGCYSWFGYLGGFCVLIGMSIFLVKKPIHLLTKGVLLLSLWLPILMYLGWLYSPDTSLWRHWCLVSCL